MTAIMEGFHTVSSLCKVLVSTLMFLSADCTVQREKFHISTTRHITGHLILARQCADACAQQPDCRTLTNNQVSEMCQLYSGKSPSKKREHTSVSITIKSESKLPLPRRNYSKGRLLVSSGRALKQISLDDRSMKSNLPYPWRFVTYVAYSEKQQLVFASYKFRLESCKVDTAVCKRLDVFRVSYIAVDDYNELLFTTSRLLHVSKMTLNGKKDQGFKISKTLDVRAAPYPEQKVLFVAKREGIRKYSYKGHFIASIVVGRVSSIAFDPETTSLYYINPSSRKNEILQNILKTREMYGKILLSFDEKPKSLLFHKKVLFTSVYNQIHQIDVSEGANITMVIDTDFGGKIDGKPGKQRKRHRRSSFLSYCYIP